MGGHVGLRRSMSPPEPIKRPLKVFLGGAAITLLVLGLIYFRMVFLAAVVGMIGGVLLEPLIRWLRVRCRLPHGVSVAVTALLVLGGLGVMVYGGYRLIAGQVQGLAEEVPEIKEKLSSLVEQLSQRFPWLSLNGEKLNVGEELHRAVGGALKLLTMSVTGLSYFLIVVILALFIAANFRSYGRGFLTLFPREKRPRVSQLGWGSIREVRRWFFGQIIVLSISASMTAVVFFAIGMDYWLVIAALTFILDFIPFFGVLITGAIAGLLTLGTEPENVGWVLLAFVFIQQVESDVVIPLVMKGRVRLPEAHLLVFILIMGTALGVIGIFVSPPLFAVLHHLYVEAYVPWVEGRGGRTVARGRPAGAP
jgi:predicted PurR-regulated permease PerM